MTARRATDERGTATLWAAGAVAALFLVAGLVLLMGTAVAARHRATAAADLAALAAAAHAPSGQSDACRKARWVSTQMRAELQDCTMLNWIAVVEVSVGPTGMLASFGAAKAHARAGPTNF